MMPEREKEGRAPARVVILGGGFGGLYTALELEKTLGDALALRNRLIANLEAADFECAAGSRDQLLSVVVAGGGFAGVETVAGIHDFVHEALRFYPHLDASLVRMVVVHPGEYLLPELGEKLGRYASAVLAHRGIEVRLGTRVAHFGEEGVLLSDGTLVPATTLVWTAGNSAHPLLSSLALDKEKGRLVVDPHLRALGSSSVWALGDCALVPDTKRGGLQPPTAQHALREGRTLARNLMATIDGRELETFDFQTLGQLAAIGRRCGVARVFGVNFSGFIAWWLWRTIYLAKLPRFEKKLRVALDWALDLLFSKDLVQLQTPRTAAEEPSQQPDPPRLVSAAQTVREENHELEKEDRHRRRRPAPRRRRPARQELEAFRSLPVRAAVGHGARGLLGRR